MGGSPTAVAERLWVGWPVEGLDLLGAPCWRGLSFPFLPDCCACDDAGLLFPAEAECWLRCDEVRGGGIGAPAPSEVVGAVISGDGCDDGALGDAPLFPLGRREGLWEEAGDAATGDDWA